MSLDAKMWALLVGLPLLGFIGGWIAGDDGKPAVPAQVARSAPAECPQPRAAAPAQPAAAPSAWIAVDGDTIKSPAGVSYRLIGFDTPEITQAKSAREREMGEAAKARLQELIDGGTVTLAPDKDRKDKYGRELARAYVNGQAVADIMIREGHARRYDGGKRQPW